MYFGSLTCGVMCFWAPHVSDKGPGRTVPLKDSEGLTVYDTWASSLSGSHVSERSPSAAAPRAAYSHPKANLRESPTGFSPAVGNRRRPPQPALPQSVLPANPHPRAPPMGCSSSLPGRSYPPHQQPKQINPLLLPSSVDLFFITAVILCCLGAGAWEGSSELGRVTV